MGRESTDYAPLLATDDGPEHFQDGSDTTVITPAPLPRTHRLLTLVVLFQGVLIIVLFVGIVWQSSRRPDCIGVEQRLYSPLQEVLEYELVKFNGGFGPSSSIYQGPPSDAVDAAWDDLYQFGISRIHKSQAALLPNKTYPILGDDDHYIVEIDVFHELHCLNQIRKAMNPEYYFPEGASNVTAILLGPHHLSHCLDSIRQSLMCSADISTIVWTWQEEHKMARSDFDIVHSCRNFEKIKEWAKEHHIKESPDLTVYLEDDIVIPEL